MKIRVTRSGGIAGLSVTWVLVVEEQPDSEEWRELVASLPRSRRTVTPTQPDRYVYLIRVQRRHVTLAEQQVTGPWRELVDRVRDRGVRE